ncbi:MAG: hypothetical protein NXI31_04660 [bacterium]|nr:hypothetical protein [bacterium]
MNGWRIATFGLAAGFVHGLAVLPAWLAGNEYRALFGFGVDEAIVLGLAVLGATTGRRLVVHAAALLLVASTLFATAAALWLVFRDQVFRLRDVGELRGLPQILFDLPPDLWVALLLVLPVLLVLHWLGYASLRRLVSRDARRGQLAWLIGLQSLVVASVLSGGAVTWHSSGLGGIVRDVARSVAEQIDAPDAATLLTPPVAAKRLLEAPADLQGLDGADVHVIIIESYGRVTFRHPAIAAHLRSRHTEWERELEAAGYAAASGACRPAISGGASLLAHAQLFTGIEVPDFRTWERLQHCGLRPLPRMFLDAGYHTVEVMPAMDRHWPEGAAFFGFEQQLTQLELGYEGFRYHFGKMPDQFALMQLLRQVIEPAEKPVFSTYVSVSSHLPCSTIPPYLSDWAAPADHDWQPARRYGTSWLNARSSPDTVPAFRDAVDYSLQTAVGFATRLQRPSIVVVVGDHQPPIKRVLVEDDFSRDVPIHVMARPPALLEALAPLGLQKGMDVPDDMVAFTSAEFAPVFVTAFSRQ